MDCPRADELKHLVLGASGFIGHHVAKRLIAGGEQVVLGSRNGSMSQAARATPLPGASEVRYCDLAGRAFDEAIAGCDVIHHYAWSTLPATAARDPVGDAEINLLGSLRLLDAMRRHGSQRLVFASSGGTVYGHGSGRPSDENDRTEPLSAYGITKLAVEHHIGSLASSGAFEARIARISNPFGSLQQARTEFGVVAHFVRKIIAGEPLRIFGNGETVRDFLYIDDLTDALFAMATRQMPPGSLICNIGGGQPTTLLQLVDAIEAVAQRDALMEFVAARAFDVDYNCLSIQRIETLYNWRPRHDLTSGLAASISQIAQTT